MCNHRLNNKQKPRRNANRRPHTMTFHNLSYATPGCGRDVSLDHVFAWKQERTLSGNLTPQNDQVSFVLDPTPEVRRLTRRRVTVIDYPNGWDPFSPTLRPSSKRVRRDVQSARPRRGQLPRTCFDRASFVVGSRPRLMPGLEPPPGSEGTARFHRSRTRSNRLPRASATRRIRRTCRRTGRRR